MLSKIYQIEQLNGDMLCAVEDTVVSEYRLAVYVGQEEAVTLLCSQDLLEELVIGYLFCAGVIDTFADIGSLTVNADAGVARATVFSREGLSFAPASGAGSDGEALFTNAEILNLANAFSEKSALFSLTGGVHSAAVCGQDGILCFAEDISRQHALHKVVGLALKSGLACGDKMLLTSGRVSSEIIAKAARGGFPLLASRSAPTDAAIDIARQQGIKLVGFARGSRMNIYS